MLTRQRLSAFGRSMLASHLVGMPGEDTGMAGLAKSRRAGRGDGRADQPGRPRARRPTLENLGALGCGREQRTLLKSQIDKSSLVIKTIGSRSISAAAVANGMTPPRGRQGAQKTSPFTPIGCSRAALRTRAPFP